MGHSVNGDLPLLHGLQQRTLSFRSGPVHLIHQNDLSVERPGAKLEGALLLVVDLYPGEVAWKQVRGTLNSSEVGMNALSQTSTQHSLSYTGGILK